MRACSPCPCSCSSACSTAVFSAYAWCARSSAFVLSIASSRSARCCFRKLRIFECSSFSDFSFRRRSPDACSNICTSSSRRMRSSRASLRSARMFACLRLSWLTVPAALLLNELFLYVLYPDSVADARSIGRRSTDARSCASATSRSTASSGSIVCSPSAFDRHCVDSAALFAPMLLWMSVSMRPNSSTTLSGSAAASRACAFCSASSMSNTVCSFVAPPPAPPAPAAKESLSWAWATAAWAPAFSFRSFQPISMSSCTLLSRICSVGYSCRSRSTVMPSRSSSRSSRGGRWAFSTKRSHTVEASSRNGSAIVSLVLRPVPPMKYRYC
eukprot:Rhum_TRINITY_DN14705_c44_g1::Rhum_TRINITY_DN14705_c44_g1_i1::g.112401::m.112401